MRKEKKKKCKGKARTEVNTTRDGHEWERAYKERKRKKGQENIESGRLKKKKIK